MVNESYVPIINLKTGETAKGLYGTPGEFGEDGLSISKRILSAKPYNDGTTHIAYVDGTTEIVLTTEFYKFTKTDLLGNINLDAVTVKALRSVEYMITLRDEREAGVDANPILNLGAGNDVWIFNDG